MRKTVVASSPTDLQLDLLLALLPGPLSSSDLLSAVVELRLREVPLATFYRQLQRAADLGWVAVGSAGPGSQTGYSSPGRPGRRYRLDESGLAVLRTEMKQLERRLARAETYGLLIEQAR